MTTLTPRPETLQPGEVEYWVDEQIWGHRLYDEQTPWLTLLEFLTVFQSVGRLDPDPTLKYAPQRQLLVRNVVFNNPHFADIDPRLPDEAAWTRWLGLMSAGAAHTSTVALGKLRNHVPDFRDFEKLIRYLRRTSIEGNSNKRWSSKFLFPFGPNALFEDLRVTESSVSNDRRFFARTGELLYMMLSRAKSAASLSQKLEARFLSFQDPTNTVLGLLQGAPDRADPRPFGYLPLATLGEYDALAADWEFLLQQPLPKHDVLPHLVLITALHLLIYYLRRAATVARAAAPTFVCEIVAPRRTAVRDLALRSFEQNQSLSRLAVESLVREVRDTTDWSNAVMDPEPLAAAAKVLRIRFDWPEEEDLANVSANTPDDLVDELVTRALGRHRQHIAKIHGTWARAIGLSSRRGSQRVRYAPTDGLLKALVLATVETRMEFKDFLAILFQRYGIVIGEQQGADLIEQGAADLEDLAENATRLEERLTSLGLMRRLSDGCAYVQAPFRGSHRG